MRALLFVLGVAALVTGCLNPDDILPVHGAVASIDGVAGHTVTLSREAPTGFAPCGAPAAGKPPFKQATTDADGGFVFELFRAQTQSLVTQGPYCFRFEVAFPSGSRAWSDTQGIYEPTTLPLLRDWRPNAEVGDGGVLRFEPPIPLPDESAVLDGSVVNTVAHQVTVLTGDGGVVWQEDDLREPLDFGPRPGMVVRTRVPLMLDEVRLEDFAGTASLRAELVESETLDDLPSWPVSSYVSSSLAAGQRLSVAGQRAPVSRGLPCDLGAPCPLTDGDLSVVELQQRDLVTLTLTTPTPLSTVVLRGLGTSAPVVAVSLLREDGGVSLVGAQLPTSQVFTAKTSGQLPDGGFDATFGSSLYAVVPLGDAGVEPVRQVTLQFPGGLVRAAEVSLFE
ncbi:MAG: hypothetical protein ACOZQL_40240 [Myxococcota bacterium]